jgi:hypothetical protein
MKIKQHQRFFYQLPFLLLLHIVIVVSKLNPRFLQPTQRLKDTRLTLWSTEDGLRHDRALGLPEDVVEDAHHVYPAVSNTLKTS